MRRVEESHLLRLLGQLGEDSEVFAIQTGDIQRKPEAEGLEVLFALECLHYSVQALLTLYASLMHFGRKHESTKEQQAHLAGPVIIRHARSVPGENNRSVLPPAVSGRKMSDHKMRNTLI